MCKVNIRTRWGELWEVDCLEQRSGFALHCRVEEDHTTRPDAWTDYRKFDRCPLTLREIGQLLCP